MQDLVVWFQVKPVSHTHSKDPPKFLQTEWVGHKRSEPWHSSTSTEQLELVQPSLHAQDPSVLLQNVVVVTLHLQVCKHWSPNFPSSQSDEKKILSSLQSHIFFQMVAH